MKPFLFLTVLFVGWCAVTAFGKNQDSMEHLTQMTLTPSQTPPSHDAASFTYEKAHNTGSLSDFPRLHPLVVHFPIVFILLAFIIQIISFFIFRRELSWVTLCLILLGFIGAFIASNLFHGGDPDPASLDAIARATFEKHEHYAYLTEVFSGIAGIAKIISHFVFKRSLWTGILVTILMGCAVYTIHTTGEMGARLVHIDAIGVQGNKIPLHDKD